MTAAMPRRDRNTRSDTERMTDDALDVLRALFMEVRSLRALVALKVAYRAVRYAKRVEDR